ncbi:Glutamate--tRNA ligase [Azospirillaceae bacterium]
MTVSVRFAPSPTGLLHVGNFRLALVNWLFARQAGGSFLLRLDDTDEERSTPEFAQAIQADLAWAGLTWDRLARESDRMQRYFDAAEKLKRDQRLYPCYETSEELDLKRATLRARGKPPIYDRSALRLTENDRARLEAQGRRPHWRFLLNHEPIEWVDLTRGPAHFSGADLSDPVLIREDGRPLYTLSSVVDDIDFDITHVIRGEDHVANTAVQIQLWKALGGAVPSFAHLPLLTDAAGQGLSKRLGSLSVASLRNDEGLEAAALLSFLARLGTPDPIEPRLSLQELIDGFNLSRISRATPKFDPEDLKRLNARLLHLLPFEAVAERLIAAGCSNPDLVFWNAVRPNLSRLSDAADWWRIAHAPVTPTLDDPALAAAAATLLPPEPWSPDTWGVWIAAVRDQTGVKGKALFMPLRRALTGREHGPELKTVLPLIGRGRAVARVAGQTA